MFLIVGLGNIGSRYDNTRHNVGFMVLDRICEEFNISLNNENNTSYYGTGIVLDKKIICMKPKTFMNLSGSAVLEIISYFKISIDNLLVIYDDIYLDVSKIRIKQRGSHAGHNGIRDIIHKINTDKFKRIKIGIGENKDIELSDYVLSKFTYDEMRMLDDKYRDISVCIRMIIEGKLVDAMNLFN